MKLALKKGLDQIPDEGIKNLKEYIENDMPLLLNGDIIDLHSGGL